MLPRLLRLHPQAHQRLIRLSKEAKRDGVYRVAKRLQAVVLNSEGRTSGDLARILKAPRSKVSEWLAPLYLSQPLKKAQTENRALIFTDEASFRQDSPLHATWSRIGHPPEVPGERKSVKILGAVELWHARFHYQQDTVFNASTYLAFLHRLTLHYRRRGAILIQDNASYHKDAEVWHGFNSNRNWLEGHQLPPYSPQLNPTERLWQYTRKNATHDRYFARESEWVDTLTRVFTDMQSYPELIRPRLLPFG